MKLLVQSDDYAISPAVARGILYGIENGIIRNTGMFMNMPWSVECGKLIMPYLDKIALGIDLNLTTGTPLTKPDLIPSLVQDNGAFHTSNESRTLDAKAENQEHAVLEEVILELENQIKRFVELFGRKPDYLRRQSSMPKVNWQRHMVFLFHLMFFIKYSSWRQHCLKWSGILNLQLLKIN